LLETFGAYFKNKPGLVSPEENLTRYIFSDRHFKRVKGVVEYAAFMPDPRGETSVFRTSNLDAAAIWEIGDRIVASTRKRLVLARADLVARFVFEASLRVAPAPISHRLHANIIGWSSDRSKQKLVALKLADKANLVLHNSQEKR
jgi:hypothetical protein